MIANPLVSVRRRDVRAVEATRRCPSEARSGSAQRSVREAALGLRSIQDGGDATVGLRNALEPGHALADFLAVGMPRCIEDVRPISWGVRIFGRLGIASRKRRHCAPGETDRARSCARSEMAKRPGPCPPRRCARKRSKSSATTLRGCCASASCCDHDSASQLIAASSPVRQCVERRKGRADARLQSADASRSVARAGPSANSVRPAAWRDRVPREGSGRSPSNLALRGENRARPCARRCSSLSARCNGSCRSRGSTAS